MGTVKQEALVKEQIINLLMKEPGLTAEAIRDRVLRHKRKPSIQSVYLELRALRKAMIVVQIKHKFYISLAWLSKRSAQFEIAVSRYSSSAILSQFLPEENTSISWNVQDLLSMDLLLVNMMLAIIRVSDDRNLYQWDPLPWYLAFQSELVSPYLEAFRRNRCSAKVAVGSDLKYFHKVIENGKFTGYQWWFGNPEQSFQHNTWLRLSGNYIIRARVPGNLMGKMLHLFNALDSNSKLPLNLAFIQLLNFQCPIRVTLTNDKRAAAKLRKIFQDTFVE